MIDDALRGILGAPDPDRTTVEFEEHIDARQVLGARDEGRIPLVDLGWLDAGPGPNPLDLKQGVPPLDGQDELVRIWIEDRPQFGGAWLVPGREKAAQDRSPAAMRPADLHAALSAASRRVHAGQPLDKVLVRLEAEVGSRVARAAEPMLRDDAGLAGRVFIREASFPGLRAGRWDSRLRVMARSARYLLSSQPADGWRKFGLEVVSEVPWAEALRIYGPHLRSRGVLAAAGTPKEVLRRSLATEQAVQAVSRRVPGRDPSKDRQAPRIAAPEMTPEQAERAGAEKMGAMTARMMVRKGLLSREKADELIAAKKLAHEVHAEVAKAAARPDPVGSYEGDGSRYGFELQARRGHGLRRDSAGVAPRNLAPLKLRKRVAKLLLRGVLTPADARRALGILEPAAAYKGDGVNFDPRQQAARDLSLPAFPDGRDLQASLKRRARQVAAQPVDQTFSKLRKRVAQMLVRGELDPERARRILDAGPAGWHKLAQYLAAPGPLPRVGPPQSAVHAYAGSLHKAAPTYRGFQVQAPTAAQAALERVAAGGGFTPVEVGSYLRWIRQARERGLAGAVLDREAQIRFSENLRAAAAPLARVLHGRFDQAAGIHEKLKKPVKPGEEARPASLPHEFSRIPDAGWNPGGVT